MFTLLDGILERTGQPISFTRFLAIGAPVTLVSLTIATRFELVSSCAVKARPFTRGMPMARK